MRWSIDSPTEPHLPSFSQVASPREEAHAASTSERGSGAHAAAVRDLIPALRGRDARRGAITDDKGSFPQTDGGHLPAARMFFAALTSRSWVSPHPLHTHTLTARQPTPAGPVRAPQLLHSRVVWCSLTMMKRLPACWLFACSCALSRPQPESNTAFAMRVLANWVLLTSPTTMT